MRVTLFQDVHARVKTERELSFNELVELIRETQAPSKRDLPLLKLATFGERCTDRGSLRHDANLQLVYGVECDYDAEIVPFEAAVDLVRAAGLRAVLYTSPSHEPSRPRWRALFPFAGQTLPPGRAKMADRANAVFDGVLARETWTLSQAFYYGSANEHFQLVALEGRFIDVAEVEERAYVAPQRPVVDNAEAIEDLPTAVKRKIKTGDPAKFGLTSRSELVLSVALGLVRAGWSEDRGAALLLDPEQPISAHVREQANSDGYARRQLRRAKEIVSRDWRRDRYGVILASDQANVDRALTQLGARFSWNVFTAQGYVNGVGPLRVLNDHEVNELRLNIDREFGFLPSKDLFYDLLDHFTHQTMTHPVLEYLDSLAWDGVRRLGAVATSGDPGQQSWLTTFGGATDSSYVRAVGRLILVAAVRRLRQPGCKFDEMLVLVDTTQGTDKSGVLRLLARREEWFTDSMPLNARDKEVIEHLAGRWIIENGELNGIKHNEVEAIKAFLSRQVDRARPAYGRLTIDAPRQCVFFGTTNSDNFLRDIQNRRFWPVKVTGFDLVVMAPLVDQLWAEAVAAEASGEPIRLAPDLWAAAAEVQWEHRQEEPWATAIALVLKDLDGKIASNDVWKIIGKPLGQRLQHDNQRLGEAMRELGFRRKHTTAYGKLQWTYVRTVTDTTERQIYVLLDPVNDGLPLASYSPTGDLPSDDPRSVSEADLVNRANSTQPENVPF